MEVESRLREWWKSSEWETPEHPQLLADPNRVRPPSRGDARKKNEELGPGSLGFQPRR